MGKLQLRRWGLLGAFSVLSAAVMAVTVDGVLSVKSRYYDDFMRAKTAVRLAPERVWVKLLETEDGRRLLWAQGPKDRTGDWFDMTDTPLDLSGFQFGIGKDSIQSIDQPQFVTITDNKRLADLGFDETTLVIGYARNGEAKAYPISILDSHELVNDVVGGIPVTVGW